MAETVLDYDILNESYFVQMADRLLNECYLLVNGRKYRLVEIEFYLNSPNHPDLYTHCNPDQLLMNTFYFHKYKTGTYKSGTYKGLDITFGSADENVYFGILIRSIQDMETDEIIDGPCNSVNRILREYDCSDVMEFTEGKNLDIFKNKRKFILVQTDDLDQEIVSMGPRIGLSEKYPDYQTRNYRFAIYKNRLKKKKTSLVESINIEVI